MWSQGNWSNNACLGYAILAAKSLGYTEEQTNELVRAIKGEFDLKTIEEAKRTYGPNE
jgi:Holliday junction resolvasome RuvABC DNA-binding subunit